jgi:hypothetical protein
MCLKSSLNIISHCPQGYIGYCGGCERYNLVFENIFILLTENDVKGLSQIIDLNYGVWIMSSPVGRGKTINFQTPVPNTFFTFTEEEYEDFKRLVNETVLMLDANEIVNVNSVKK